MTAQEEQMLEGLTERISAARLDEKDDQAEQMLQEKLGHNPDAMYILAQTVLVQQYALDQAQKQLADARAQLAQAQAPPPPKHATSFLGNLLGQHDEPPPPPPQQYAPGYAPVPGYASAPQYAPAPQYVPAPQYGMPQQGGFLRSALQTATGVAAGALAFEGIESLMHGFGHAAGYGSGFGSGLGGGRPEEIVNNYYGDAAPHGPSGGLSPDIEDRRGDSRFSNAVDSGDHGTVYSGDAVDDTANDFAGDSSADDSSSGFDSGGDFDSGGGGDDSGS